VTSPAQPHILGQGRAVAALGRALSSGHLHHAWILHGPAGVGKFRAAEAMARILLDPESTAAQRASLEPPRGTPAARMLDSGTHTDLHVIRKELAALSDSRELRERKQLSIPLDLLRERMIGGTAGDGRHHESAVFRTPALGHWKVFVVDEAELLHAEAQNAMLKTLEEPPARTTIVLVTQQEEQLLPTIRSRCQRVAFGPLDPASMRAWWARGGPDVPAADRAFLEEFAAGSPGVAALAAEHGIAGWSRELSPLFDALEGGRFPAGLSERMAEIVDEYAKGIVDADESASKDAANRAAVRMLAQLLGMRARRGLAQAGGDPGSLARWLGAAEALGEFERLVRSNANLKLAIANLVAQWAERTAPAGAAHAR
jgi:DNA polymerase-3 subunit delta'